MSIPALNAVFESDVGPANKRLLLLALADNANDRGLCKPGVAHLVGKTGIPRSTVFELLKKLEAEDLLERRERRRINGSRRSNAYKLNLELLKARRRVVTQEEADELDSLFDDESEPGEAAGQLHSPGAGPCEHDLAKPQVNCIVREPDVASASSGDRTGVVRLPDPRNVREPDPLNHHLNHQGEGGTHATSDRLDERPPPSNDPPPPRSPQRGRPETWKCARHLAEPDPHDRPCRACKQVRERCEQRELELAAEEAARKREERIAALERKRAEEAAVRDQGAEALASAGHAAARAVVDKLAKSKTGHRPPGASRRRLGRPREYLPEQPGQPLSDCSELHPTPEAPTPPNPAGGPPPPAQGSSNHKHAPQAGETSLQKRVSA